MSSERYILTIILSSSKHNSLDAVLIFELKAKFDVIWMFVFLSFWGESSKSTTLSAFSAVSESFSNML